MWTNPQKTSDLLIFTKNFLVFTEKKTLTENLNFCVVRILVAQKIKFSYKKFFNKSDQIYTYIFFLLYIYNLHFLKQKVYSHQVLIYLNVPGIPLRKPLQNKQIVEEQWDVWVLGVICASFLTGRHLLMNKKDRNSRYTNMKIMIIWRKTLLTRQSKFYMPKPII